MTTFTRDRLRIEARRSVRPLLIYGAAGALMVLAVWVLFHNLTGVLPWKSYREVRVAVSDAKGIVAGQQEVRAAGIRVGVVKAVDLEGRQPVLTLALDKSYGPLYRNARLRLRPVTPLQDIYVAIENRGTAAGGKLSGSDVLAARRTVVPVDISRVLDIFDRSTRDRLTVLLDQLGKGLPDKGVALRRTFAEVAPFLDVAGRTTKAMSDRRADLAKAVHDMNLLTGVLAQRDRQLATLVSDGNRTMAAVAGRGGALDATLRELAPTLDALDRSFTKVQAMQGQLDPALRELQPVAASLRSGLVSLRSFSQEAEPALAALRTPVRKLRPLARSLAPTTRSAGDTIATLQPQAPEADTVTKLTVPCLPHAGKFFWRTLSLTKMGDVNGATPRADVAVSLATPSLLRQKDTLLLDQLMPCWRGKVAP